jgi:hypothetical protein
MTTDEALDLLDTLLQEQSLRDLQEQVFRYSWEGLTYPRIAKHVGYDTGYIRDIGYELWRQLTQTLGERVTKNNVHVVLRRQLNRKAGFVDLMEQQSFRKLECLKPANISTGESGLMFLLSEDGKQNSGF